MPRPRFAKLDPAKKEAILGAALEEFATNGYDGASYNQIIEKAGISKGAMYYYFDDKEDLFATVVRRELEEVMVELVEVPEVSTEDEFWQMLLAIMDRAHSYVLENPLKMKLVRSLWKLREQGEKSPLIHELYEMGRGFSVNLLQLGQGVGAVRSDLPFELLVDMVTAVDEVGDRWTLDHLDEIPREKFEEWGRAYVDLLQRILEKRQPEFNLGD